jgi:hypothetical protein
MDSARQPNSGTLSAINGTKPLNCVLFLVHSQRKCPRRDAPPIPRCEKITLQAVVVLVLIVRELPLHRREAAVQNVPVCVQEKQRRVRAAVAAAVEVVSIENIGFAPP